MKIYVLLLIYIIIKYVCVCLCACVCTHVHEVLQGGGNHVGIFLYEIDIKLTILKTTSIFIQQIFIDYVLHVQQCGNDQLSLRLHMPLMKSKLLNLRLKIGCYYSQFRRICVLQSNSFKMPSLIHLILYRSQRFDGQIYFHLKFMAFLSKYLLMCTKLNKTNSIGYYYINTPFHVPPREGLLFTVSVLKMKSLFSFH